jgi:hypothetical protein
MSALAAIALLGSAAGVDCSKAGGGSPRNVGGVSLALTLQSGVRLTSVHYVIHAGMPTSIPDAQGDIDTTADGAEPAALVSFPTSTGDTVTLSGDTTATMTQPSEHCQGSALMPFDVIGGASTEVMVNVVCGGGSAAGTGNSGNVRIGGTVSEAPGTGDNCPQITSWNVSPLQASVPAGTIAVTADATDADPGETATLVFDWAPASKFSVSRGKVTDYSCLVSGPDTITLTVTDAHMPTPCQATIQFAVNCVDSGAGGSGGAGGAGGNCGVCPNCYGCEQADTQMGICSNTSTPSANPTDITQFGCNGFTGAARSTCEGLQSCLLGPSCKSAIANAPSDYGESVSGYDDPLPCLCGEISKSACVHADGSTLDGVCASQYRAAAAADGNPSVVDSIYDPQFNIGIATNVFTCYVDSNNPTFKVQGAVPCSCSASCCD